MIKKRPKLIIADAISLIVEVNEFAVKSRKRGETPRIRLPGAFDRAFAVYHEGGIIPFEEVVSESEAD